MNAKNICNSLLFGIATGDALGVPVEFQSRESLVQNPVVDMVGFGTHNQPPGTWSDDSSLSFCLAESLAMDGDLNAIAQNFVKWKYDNFWTAGDEVFDIGAATEEAIAKLYKGMDPSRSGRTDELSNGNGSLMRIAPLVFFLLDKPMHKRFEITRQISSITHGHIRSIIASFYYLEFARQLLKRKDKFEIYRHLKNKVGTFLKAMFIERNEMDIYSRLLQEDIYKRAEKEIASSGYVLHTLEASIWCLLTTDNYKDAVLKAVNLGEDTDTTSAVTGGLAGLLYGFETIPQAWINTLAKSNEISQLATRMANKFDSQLRSFEHGIGQQL
ncbi:MAG: ADP-ribosylglycohydrolase family protein [Ginsengibacter sp.]